MSSRWTNRWLVPVALATLIALTAATPAAAKRYMTTGFRNTEDRPVVVALLPPHAEFIKAKAVMTEQMIKECEALEASASNWLERYLQEKGYTVKVITAEDVKADSELSELMREANERYDEEWSRLIRRPKKIKFGRYNAGESSQKLAAALEVDGLIFPRVQAVGVTGGKKALTALMSLGNYVAQGYARLDISVIDGSNGDVEAYFFFAKASNLKPLVRKPDKVMMQVARAALRKYPQNGEVLKVKNIPEEEDDEGAADEEAVLGELEMLLGPDEDEQEEEEETQPE